MSSEPAEPAVSTGEPDLPETGPASPEKLQQSVSAEIRAPLASVWDAWVNPGDIQNWNFAVAEWCCPKAEIDLREGGRFRYRMESRDGNAGFDFEGTFTAVVPNERIEFQLEDGRTVQVAFSETDNGIEVVETFEAEDEQSAEQQRHGWQRILNNFKRYVEEQGK